MTDKIGVPTVSGMKTALKDAAIGAVGGLLYALSTTIFGSGLWGGIAGIVIAGSVIKGQASETISTVLGFEIGKNLLSGGGSSGSSSNSGSVVV